MPVEVISLSGVRNQSLMDAAQECSARHSPSHHNREECEAVADAGYPHGFGSNLTVLVGAGMNRIAEKAVTNWKNSPGHLETMVDADYEEVGVGVTIDNGTNKTTGLCQTRSSVVYEFYI